MHNKKYLKSRDINPIMNLYTGINPNYYHTFLHYMDCMNTFNKFKKELNEEWRRTCFEYNNTITFDERYYQFFNLVFLWHDSVYLPIQSDGNTNEELSAREAEKFMRKAYGKNYVNYDILEAIKSTAYNYDIQNMPEETIGQTHFKFLCKVIHDIDWFNFSDYEMCVKAERKVINESMAFTGLSANEVKAARLAFYKEIVNTDLYLTETFGKYNENAKKNIKIRIAKLEATLNKKKGN